MTERKGNQMRRDYVVIDESGQTSFNSEKEAPEKFKTFKAARKRAEELAADSPGRKIGIYELTAEAECSVGKPVTSRAHMLEHYEP